MNPQQFFIAFNLIFQILNGYVAFWTYNRGHLVYFILFWIIYGMEKVCSFLFQPKTMIRTIKILFGDVYYLKNLFSWSAYESELRQGEFFLKMLMNIFPFILLNVFYRTEDISANTNEINQMFIIQIIIMVLGSLLYILNCTEESLRVKEGIRCFIAHTSYFLSLRCMMNYDDFLGINLLYYHIPLVIISISLFIYHMPYTQFSLLLYLIAIMDGIYSNYQFACNKIKKRVDNFYEYHMIENMSYSAQLLRLILILSYANLKKAFQSQEIKDIEVLLAIILSVIHLIFTMKRIYKSNFEYQYFNFNSIEDIQRVVKSVQTDQKNYKRYYYYLSRYFKIICRCYSQDFMINPQQEQHLPPRDENYYIIQKSISHLLKRKKQVFLQFNNVQRQKCSCKILQLLNEEEFIHQQNYQLIRMQKIEGIRETFFIRYDKGFIFSEVTNQLLLKFKDDEKQLLNDIITSTYSSIVFHKQIKSCLETLPQLVQYDLFTDD